MNWWKETAKETSKALGKGAKEVGKGIKKRTQQVFEARERRMKQTGQLGPITRTKQYKLPKKN